jgi:glycosyltransferase involved in cell wall biosynthesis
VIAYSTKGPKDIIEDGVCGYLVNIEEQMSQKIIAYLDNPQQQKDFRKAAVKRAKNYETNGIVERFVADVGLKFN